MLFCNPRIKCPTGIAIIYSRTAEGIAGSLPLFCHSFHQAQRLYVQKPFDIWCSLFVGITFTISPVSLLKYPGHAIEWITFLGIFITGTFSCDTVWYFQSRNIICSIAPWSSVLHHDRQRDRNT